MYLISDILLELCKIKAIVNSVDNALVRGTMGNVDEEQEEAFLLLAVLEDQISALIESVESREAGAV